MMQFLRILCGLLLAALMTACGGGGGSPGTTTTGGSGSGSSGGTAVTNPTVTVDIVNANGASTPSVTVGGAFVAKATVKDAGGAAVTNRMVTFSVSNSAIATLSPSTALTNSSGVAQVAIAPASISAVGAGTLSASAVVGTATFSGSVDFAVSATSLSLSDVVLGSSSLPSGGNTSLTVTALIGGTASAVPVNVAFSASCGRINNSGASIGTTTNGSGVASAVYSAVNADGTLCSGPVTITASSSGTTARSASLTVAAPVANAITFVSASPAQIFVSGSGALEQSLVKFKALSGSTPLANLGVRISLLVNPGGVGLGASGSTSDVTATTDSAGEVTISVFSGTIPGPVKVRASLASNSSVFAETQNLSVSSGPPSQKFLSLSAETFNIEGANRDGVSTKLIARLADRQGNPVEDGTVVNFTAEGGQVASSCTTVKASGISSCSVDFNSQNPRPVGGRVSILAYASGTKDYVDGNGNNSYDSGEQLANMGDAYRDDNENNLYDTGEFVVPRGGTLACPGTGGQFPSRENTCDLGLATTIRQQFIILFSSSKPAPLNKIQFNTSFLQFTLGSSDNPLLPMPSGTTVKIEVADLTPGGEEDCSVDKVIGTTVGNTYALTTHEANFKNCSKDDRVIVTVKAPSGLETPIPFPFP
jgi:hypothetical protein